MKQRKEGLCGGARTTAVGAIGKRSMQTTQLPPAPLAHSSPASEHTQGQRSEDIQQPAMGRQGAG